MFCTNMSIHRKLAKFTTNYWNTVKPHYPDTLQTRKKCHHKRSVAVTGVGEIYVYKSCIFYEFKIILNCLKFIKIQLFINTRFLDFGYRNTPLMMTLFSGLESVRFFWIHLFLNSVCNREHSIWKPIFLYL